MRKKVAEVLERAAEALRAGGADPIAALLIVRALGGQAAARAANAALERASAEVRAGYADARAANSRANKLDAEVVELRNALARAEAKVEEHTGKLLVHLRNELLAARASADEAGARAARAELDRDGALRALEALTAELEGERDDGVCRYCGSVATHFIQVDADPVLGTCASVPVCSRCPRDRDPALDCSGEDMMPVEEGKVLP
jgi:hypothetical protein